MIHWESYNNRVNDNDIVISTFESDWIKCLTTFYIKEKSKLANITKMTDNIVAHELRHALRLIHNNSNSDIDPNKFELNEQLSEKRDLSPYRYYKKRLSEVFHFNRKDLVTLVGVVITCPKEVTDPVQQKRFFEVSLKFCEHAFGGKKNIVLGITHYDEGKELTAYDENGNILYHSHVGAPHLHVYAMPICKITQPQGEQKERKRKSAKDNYTEHCSARELLNRTFFQTFHSYFQNYIDTHLDFPCRVLTGATERQGGNRTVAELKQSYEQLKNLVPDLMRENESLRERVSTLEHELEQARNMTHENVWGNDPTWDTQRIGGYEWEQEFT